MSSKDHKKEYLIIWGALLFLTFVTVWIASFDFGTLNILVAMLIATVKAALVCLFFMHLKYDNRVNQVVFLSSIFFLVVFAALTLSDALVRPSFPLAKVNAVELPAEKQASKMETLRHSTDKLVTSGQKVFALQCALCHGASGGGDGPAGAALKPSPRNLTAAAGWTNGREPSSLFKTLTEGLPGTAMAAYDSLSIDDRWSLVHYVRTLSDNPPSDTQKTLALIGLGEKVENSTPKKKKLPTLPVDFIIERMAE